LLHWSNESGMSDEERRRARLDFIESYFGQFPARATPAEAASESFDLSGDREMNARRTEKEIAREIDPTAGIIWREMFGRARCRKARAGRK